MKLLKVVFILSLRRLPLLEFLLNAAKIKILLKFAKQYVKKSLMIKIHWSPDKKNCRTPTRGMRQHQSVIANLSSLRSYIIPPMPGFPIGISGFSSGLSQMTHSVVRNIPATEAAFSKATRATLAGSTTPAARRSSYCSVLAL